MATTIENNYVGDGTTILFSFTFPYIDSTDVKTSLDDVVTTEFTLANATTVQFDAPPASGVEIKIYRATSVEEPKAIFYPGSSIRAKDLNDNFEQNIFVIQEASFDTSQSAADSAAALATAEEAETKADQAVTTANTALTDSATALAASNQAAADAAQAQADATSAADDADEAAISASQANQAVQTAQVYQPVANVAAIPSSPSDQDRVSVRDSSNIYSLTPPIFGLPVGPSFDSGLFVNIIYDDAQSRWEFVNYGPTDPDVRYLQDIDGSVSGDNLVDEGIMTGKLADGAVTAPKLDPNLIFVPTGAITAFGGSTAPTGYLECNGQSTSGYPELAAVVGTNVPDLRDQFIRGASANRSVGSSQGYSTARPVNASFTTDSNGSHSHGINANGSHTHAYAIRASRGAETGGSGFAANYNTTNYTSAAGSHTHSMGSAGNHAHTITGGGDSETRPMNIALMYIIKT